MRNYTLELSKYDAAEWRWYYTLSDLGEDMYTQRHQGCHQTIFSPNLINRPRTVTLHTMRGSYRQKLLSNYDIKQFAELMTEMGFPLSVEFANYSCGEKTYAGQCKCSKNQPCVSLKMDMKGLNPLARCIFWQVVRYIGDGQAKIIAGFLRYAADKSVPESEVSMFDRLLLAHGFKNPDGNTNGLQSGGQGATFRSFSQEEFEREILGYKGEWEGITYPVLSNYVPATKNYRPVTSWDWPVTDKNTLREAVAIRDRLNAERVVYRGNF